MLHQRGDVLVRRFTFVLGLIALAPSPTAAQTVYVDSPLTAAPSGAGVRGGSFGPDGWTVTGGEDTLWIEIADAIPEGSVEVTVSNLSTSTNLTGALHDVLVIYGMTDEPEPVRYAPFFRSNDYKVQVRIIGTGEPSRGPGASKLELRLCRAGDPGYHESCPAACPELVQSAYLNGAPLAPLPWNASRSYRLRVSWQPGSITYDRGDSPVRIDYPGTFAPGGMRVRLGSPRHTEGTPDHLPIGMTFSDLRVVGSVGAPSASCGATTPPPGTCLEGVSLTPNSGSGITADLRAVYSHCDGADAFRIVQIGVADEIAVGVDSVGANLEGGRFGIGTMSCAPGESATIALSEAGGLDCSRSSFTVSGDTMIVSWGLYFDPSVFAGDRGGVLRRQGWRRDARAPAGMDPHGTVDHPRRRPADRLGRTD